MARFANPYVKDTLLRLAADASDRIPKFVLPVVIEREKYGHASPLAAAIVASWAAFARGVDEEGERIEMQDRQAHMVARAVARQQDDGLGFLRDSRLFADLADSKAFAPYFEQTYREIATAGAQQALRWVLENGRTQGK